MGRADYYAEGSWNATCYQCGFKFKAFQLRKHWQGYYVCASCWEPRQPQDFVRARAEVEAAPWVQPSTWTAATGCTPQGVSAVPGEAQPGCATPGYLSPMYIDNFFTP